MVPNTYDTPTFLDRIKKTLVKMTEMNLDIVNKTKLLQKKVEELQSYFESTDFEIINQTIEECLLSCEDNKIYFNETMLKIEKLEKEANVHSAQDLDELIRTINQDSEMRLITNNKQLSEAYEKVSNCLIRNLPSEIPTIVMDNNTSSLNLEQKPLDQMPTTRMDNIPLSETTHNQLYRGFITTTIRNISGLPDDEGKFDQTRKTHDATHKKVVLLTHLKTWLSKNQLEPHQEKLFMALVEEICLIRRHRYNIFSKPHSSREWDKFVTNNKLLNLRDNPVIIPADLFSKILNDPSAISTFLNQTSTPTNIPTMK